MTSLRDYVVGPVLGRGGFAVVFRAKLLSTGKEVALKQIDKLQMKKHKMLARVINEVEIHTQLKHPSLIELYNYFEDATNFYLVLEYCSRGELFHHLKSKGRLPEDEARSFMRQLVEGVAYLHSHGIIHRDLKLSNALLTEDYKVKISDFGLAAKLSSVDGERKTLCGTPNYIPPEVIERQPYGLASDIWSLGCMLYTMLTGSAPFEDKETENTLARVMQATYELPEYLSPQAKDLISRFLQKNPRNRIALAEVLSHPFFLRQPCGLPSPSPNKCVPLRPLNTARLRPMRQTTKKGEFHLLASGEVLLDSPAHKRLVYVSPNGATVREVGRDGNASDVREYTFPHLPPKTKKLYHYAYCWLSLVKAGTPKLRFYSRHAKCYLMENEPADFVALFDTAGPSPCSQGLRVHYSPSRATVSVVAPHAPKLELSGLAGMEDAGGALPPEAPPAVRWAVDHAVDCWRRCVAIEAVLATGPEPMFPLLVSARSSSSSSSSSASSSSSTHSAPPAELPSQSPGASQSSLGSTSSSASEAAPPPLVDTGQVLVRSQYVDQVGWAMLFGNGAVVIHGAAGGTVATSPDSLCVEVNDPSGRVMGRYSLAMPAAIPEAVRTSLRLAWRALGLQTRTKGGEDKKCAV